MGKGSAKPRVRGRAGTNWEACLPREEKP